MILNYVQHIFKGGEKFCRVASPVTLVVGTDTRTVNLALVQCQCDAGKQIITATIK